MSQDLISWAVPRMKRLLPLDDESIREIIVYTQTLTKEAGVEHLSNILGDAPQSYEFISDFSARSQAKSAPVSTPSTTDSGVPRHVKKSKPKAPLHDAGPVRRPEGYGDVSSGYIKQTDSDWEPRHRKGNSGSRFDTSTISSQPEALQLPKVTQGGLQTPSSGRSREPSPGHSSLSLMPPSASGKLISDLPNVRTKQVKKHVSHAQQSGSGSSTPGRDKGASTVTSNIADLTSAIAALELSTNPKLSNERRKCDCNASIHPLFTTAPNCMNCGKIICALEGLQPCSFCDTAILSKDQVDNMIRALKEERGVEKMANHNANVAKSSSGTPMFSSPDVSDNESAAGRARAHRDRLLAFQRDNVQRTKVHDEAADFDVSLTPGATQWMSATQRAAALKKQQAYLREMEEMNRPEWERKKTVMSMSVRNGKLIKTFEKVKTSMPKTEVEEEIVEEGHKRDEERQQLSGKGAFSNNPLLVSGQLIRPIWQPKDHDAKEGKQRERKSVWRRVQDDTEDNEQWILDGGLKGFDVETRTMEDGSQQECG